MAQTWGFDNSKLQLYGIGTEIGGWHNIEALSKWPVGSIWGVEGDVLYALVRYLDPEYVVELGTYHGCSATHIAMALHHNGSGGKLICVENGGYGLAQPDRVPSELLSYMTFKKANAEDFMASKELDGKVGLIFEDSAHDTETTRRVWVNAARKLKAGGVILSHDAEHYLVGKAIRDGIVASGIDDFRTYRILSPQMNQTDLCGLAMWRKPEETIVYTDMWETPDKAMQPEMLARANEIVGAIEDAKVKVVNAPKRRTPAKRKTPAKRQAKAK